MSSDWMFFPVANSLVIVNFNPARLVNDVVSYSPLDV